MKTNTDISRREAIKKVGYGAFTLTTMMTLLNGTTAKAGDWDDVNAANGFATPRSASPSASPDVSTNYDLSASMSGVTHGEHYVITVQITNNGTQSISLLEVSMYADSVYLGSDVIHNLHSGQTGHFDISVSEQYSPVEAILTIGSDSLTKIVEVFYS